VATERSVVLFSGGVDSTIALHWAKAHGEVLVALTIDYAQRHWVEVRQAARIARKAGVPHEIETLGARGLGARALLARQSGEIATAKDAVVPCRNMLFLGLAAVWAETLGADSIVVGFSLDDAATFHDCRPPFIRSAADTISHSLGHRIRIRAPLVSQQKHQSLELAKSMPGCWDGLALSWTCYSPVQLGNKGHVKPCGVCPSCVLRAESFAKAGLEDPAAPEIRV
jgi:7-cyano-7-deazaguanine synthase